jgi:hypothetical protein
VNISQSNLIIGSILIGYVIYITVKGELPSYLGIIGLGANPTPAVNQPTASAQGTAAAAAGLVSPSATLPMIPNIGDLQ